MKPITFDRIISFLFGASWAFLIIGAYLVFTSTLIFGAAFAFFLTLSFIFISLFSFIVLESINMSKKRLLEVEKQTKILQKLEAKLSEHS